MAQKEQSHRGEPTPIIDQPLWDAVEAQLASNAAERNSSARHRQPSLLAGLLFDGDDNRMTPSHAVKKGTRYRYYVSCSLIAKDWKSLRREYRQQLTAFESDIDRSALGVGTGLRAPKQTRWP